MINRREFALGALGMACTVPLVGCTTGQLSSSISTGTASSTVISTVSTGDESIDYVEHINKENIMLVDIAVNQDTWQTMLDNAINEEYVQADITINGIQAQQVGIRPKGNSSLSSIANDSTTNRYSFKVKFDEYVDEQTWLGLDKLVLNGNWADATSMKEYFSYDTLEAIGVATPLFAYANITLNNEPWGFYLAIEDMDKAYRRRQHSGKGEMYKPDTMSMGGNMGGGMGNMGGARDNGEAMPNWSGEEGAFPEGFTPPEGDASGEMPEGLTMPEGMELPEEFSVPEEGETGVVGRTGGAGGGMGSDDAVALIYIDDEIASYSSIFDNAETNSTTEDHKRVIEAIKNLNTGTNLETYVDVQACLRYFAAHTSVVSLDSYQGSMGHNYYLYENNGQITMLPWDYNMSFGGFMSGDASSVVNFPIDTPVSGVSMEQRPLMAKLFEVPEYLKQYHAYLQTVVDECYAGNFFASRVDALHELISPYMESDPSAFYTYDEYLAALEEFKKLGSLRGESLQGQLDGTIPSTSNDQTDPDQLIDASSVDLSLLGGQDAMGGGGMGGMDNMEGRIEGMDNRGDGSSNDRGSADITLPNSENANSSKADSKASAQIS